MAERDFRFQPKPIALVETPDGCLGLWEQSTDYRLTEWLLDALPTLYQQDEIIFEYNQFNQKRSQKSCTIFNPVWAISDLWNVEVPLDTIKAWDNDSYNHGRKQGEGRWVQLGVDFIVDKWNASEFATKYGKVAYYSIDLKDDGLVKRVLDKRYTICTWYNGNANYNNDKNADWKLDGTSFWKSTYWHAINVIWSTSNPARVKDNYKWLKYNIYEVTHKFSEIPCFFEKGYVITKVKEDKLEELKRLNEMNTILITMIENNSRMWHLTNDKKLKIQLHDMNESLRLKQKDVENEIKKCM